MEVKENDTKTGRNTLFFINKPSGKCHVVTNGENEWHNMPKLIKKFFTATLKEGHLLTIDKNKLWASF